MAAVAGLETDNRARVVSRPVVLTQENVPAIFDNNRTFYAKLVGERNCNSNMLPTARWSASCRGFRRSAKLRWS